MRANEGANLLIRHEALISKYGVAAGRANVSRPNESAISCLEEAEAEERWSVILGVEIVNTG